MEAAVSSGQTEIVPAASYTDPDSPSAQAKYHPGERPASPDTMTPITLRKRKKEACTMRHGREQVEFYHETAQKWLKLINRQSIERRTSNIDITPGRLPPTIPASPALLQMTGNLSLTAKLGALSAKHRSRKRRSGSFNTSNIEFAGISKEAKRQRQREDIHKQLKPKEEKMFAIFCGDHSEDPDVMEATNLSQRFQEFQELIQDEDAKKALASRVPKKPKALPETQATPAVKLEQNVAADQVQNSRAKRPGTAERNGISKSKKRKAVTQQKDENVVDLQHQDEPAFKMHVWTIFQSTLSNLKHKEAESATTAYQLMNEADRAMLAESWDNCPGNPDVITAVERLRGNQRFASWAADNRGVNVLTCDGQTFVNAALAYSKRYGTVR